MSIFDQVVDSKKPFKFFNMLTEHESFLSVVESAWKINIRGSRQYILCKKLSVVESVVESECYAL